MIRNGCSTTLQRSSCRVIAAVVPALWLAVPALAQTKRTPEPAEPAAAPEPGEAIQPEAGASVKSLFNDFLHYARIGRFQAANAHARALLAHPKLDPVELAQLADADPQSIHTLILIVKNSSLSESATKVFDVIHQGEFEMRKDPVRIKQNIDKLGGDPQTEYNAIKHLSESGEYAIPWMLQALDDPARRELRPRIVRALPKIGKSALNPLVIALNNVPDADLKMIIVRALGQIEYGQSIPYLSKLIATEGVTAELRTAASEAIARIANAIGHHVGESPAQQFFALSEQNYNEHGSVKADPRDPIANVWYWDASNRFLNKIAVPTAIFGPIMAMRTSEEAIRFQPDYRDAIALWLAADIRREARLGMNVESGEADSKQAADETRPPNFPRSIYFVRAAGPAYAHLVLQRAVADRDGAVALGAIAALQSVAGASSLIGSEDYKQPLVQALEFPDAVVRIKAAIAIGRALPTSPFFGAQNVVPILGQALAQSGKGNVIVVDPDGENLNRVMGLLRNPNITVLGEANFLKALERARRELDSVSAILLASDIRDPGLSAAVGALRKEFVFGATPIIVLTKPKEEGLAADVVAANRGVAQVDAAADGQMLATRLSRVAAEVGQTTLTPDSALELALEAAETLRGIALNGRTVLDFGAAEPMLVSALASPSEELRVTCASVLALAETASAQRALSDLALKTDNTESLRVAVFGSLADSAKHAGNKLTEEQVNELVKQAMDEPNLNLRTAASKALGALNLTTSKASEIIRKYYGG
ncbi:MAG TPA: HEAT repeat domain-containing protein [Phycisphaerae bacterium]